MLTWLMSGFAAACSVGTDRPLERPNVVVIVSDDHGWGDVGWNTPQVRTPHLDQLATDGIRLDRFYANPVCSVTRAAFLTGLSSLRTGVNNRSGLELAYRILPQAFRDAGYQTWMCGKWHLGGTEENTCSTAEFQPHHRGFDYFYGHLHGAIDYYTHERKDLKKLDWQRNGEPIVEDGFSTDLLAEDAIRLVRRRDPTRPFLLYLAFNGVHGPLSPPPSAPGLDKRDRRALLLANLAHLDRAVGRLLAAIDQENLRTNALVLFFGDNGGQLSQGASNGSLRDEKGSLFEGGIRVPAAMRWPAVLRAGQVSKQFVSVMDLLPTLCSAAGIPTGVDRPLDGIDLWPALVQGRIQPHPPFVMGLGDRACISAPWKLVQPGSGEAPMLFDIVADPDEKTDLAARHPEVVAELSEHIATIGKPQTGRGEKGDRLERFKRATSAGIRNTPRRWKPSTPAWGGC